MHPEVLLLAAAGLFPAFAHAGAQSIEIEVLKARYTTELLVSETKELHPGPPFDDLVTTVKTQTTTSPAPISNELRGSSELPDELVLAKASADTFSVSTQTVARLLPNSRANAVAETMLTFNTLKDQVASLTLDFAPSSLALTFGSGFVSLYDTTAGLSVFDYGWVGNTGTIPWDFSSGSPRASLELNHWLHASHTYALTIRANTNANLDGSNAAIHVSGFHPVAAPVPEPELYAMMFLGLGLVGLAALRRKGGRQT